MPTLTLARINWKHYTTGGAAAVSETTRRKGRLDLSQLMIMCFNFIWFCSGQGAPSRAGRTREGTHARAHARVLPPPHRGLKPCAAEPPHLCGLAPASAAEPPLAPRRRHGLVDGG